LKKNIEIKQLEKDFKYSNKLDNNFMKLNQQKLVGGEPSNQFKVLRAAAFTGGDGRIRQRVNDQSQVNNMVI
jgi:hypothetical protein